MQLHSSCRSFPLTPIAVNKIRDSVSGAGSKLTGAFKKEKRDRGLNDLDLDGGNGDGSRGFGEKFSSSRGFKDGPTLPRLHMLLHCVAVFFTFLAICTMAAVAAFQGKWFGVSGGSGFVLFLLLFSFLLSTTLLVIPILYDRYDKARIPALFLAQSRSAFILHVFGTLLIIVAAFVVTISAWTEPGCKNPDNDPHEKLGDDYKNGLKGWCNTKKATGIMAWLAFGAWAGLLAFSTMEFWKDRRAPRREAPFEPPVNVDDLGATGAYNPVARGEEEERDNIFSDRNENVFADRQDAPTARLYAGGGGSSSVYTVPAIPAADSAMSRPSMDVYGAFDGDMPGSMPPGMSRTMQMAYQDPYDNVRATVMNQPYAPSTLQFQPPVAPATAPAPTSYSPTPPSYHSSANAY